MAATRWALVAAGTVLVAGLGSGVASAVEPAATPTLALSVASGPPGAALTAKGAHFGAGHAVDLLVDRTSVGTAYAGATGSFTARISIPKSARPGRHTVSAVSGTRSATASFLVRTDWPQYRGDAGRTGANPTENVITASTVRTLKPAWQVRTPDDQGLVAVAGGAVYLPSATTLTALDAATGATRWTQHAQFGFFTAVAVGGGRLVTVNGNHVVALAPATGAVLWTSPLAGQLLSQPVVTPNMIFIEGDDNRDVGRVWGIDPATGAIRWTSVPPLENFGVSMPAYADGRVFAGTIGKLRAFDAGTGALLWTAPVDDALNRQTLVVTGGTVYFVGNHVNAFDAATGTHRWTTLLDNEVDTNPAVAGGCSTSVRPATVARPASGTSTTCTHWTRPPARSGGSSPTVPPGSAIRSWPAAWCTRVTETSAPSTRVPAGWSGCGTTSASRRSSTDGCSPTRRAGSWPPSSRPDARGSPSPAVARRAQKTCWSSSGRPSAISSSTNVTNDGA